ncbi:hypothetical protein [Streptomyces sp. NPDC093707]|uniref:hypothetical protein n=1 Tax=Streptomyces sp. NPDC093707 TaxID=3154984 RepID=UPI00344B2E02
MSYASVGGVSCALHTTNFAIDGLEPRTAKGPFGPYGADSIDNQQDQAQPSDTKDTPRGD